MRRPLKATAVACTCSFLAACRYRSRTKNPRVVSHATGPAGVDGPNGPVDGRPAPGWKGYGREASWRRGNGDKANADFQRELARI
jgi:hypothetical protein